MATKNKASAKGAKSSDTRIRFLGTGCLESVRKNTSFIFDDHILFDVGFGVVSYLRENGLDVSDVDTIVISHFHPDHIGDIMFFLIRYWEFSRKGMTKPLTIIGPVGTRHVFVNHRKTFVGFEGGGDITTLLALIDRLIDGVIELDDGGTFKNENLTAYALRVVHGSARCNAYILDINGHKIGCTGDSCLCPSLESNFKNADMWILDCSRRLKTDHPGNPNYHMNLELICDLAAQYPDKTFYCVHRKDWAVPSNLPVNVICPNDNDKFGYC